MAIAVGRNQPNSYRIESIVISNNEGNSYDVSNLMQSFQITESIYQMFLTGHIVLLDNINLFNVSDLLVKNIFEYMVVYKVEKK